MSIINPATAMHGAIENIGITDRDMVVVNTKCNDGRSRALVQRLRNEVGFNGKIYGFAPTQRLRSKLTKAGCTTVFGSKESNILGFLQAAFPTSRVG
jgi:hypothetical protein